MSRPSRRSSGRNRPGGEGETRKSEEDRHSAPAAEGGDSSSVPGGYDDEGSGGGRRSSRRRKGAASVHHAVDGTANADDAGTQSSVPVPVPVPRSPSDLDPHGHVFNIPDVPVPHVGLRVDLLDTERIWSPATVLSVGTVSSTNEEDDADDSSDSSGHGNGDGGGGGKHVVVTLGYDGWGDEWNETLTWPHDRIARLFTYTRRVRAFVDLNIPRRPWAAVGGGKTTSSSSDATTASKKVGGKKRKIGGDADDLTTQTGGRRLPHSPLWPCRVSMRMPHPTSERAAQLLTDERHVHVEPYVPPGYHHDEAGGAPQSWDGPPLPREVTAALLGLEGPGNSRAGRWIAASRLRQWRSPDELFDSTGSYSYEYAPGFHHAHLAGEDDGRTRTGTTPGVLPLRPFEGGSLPSEWYRVRTVGGDEGTRYDGSFPTLAPPRTRRPGGGQKRDVGVGGCGSSDGGNDSAGATSQEDFDHEDGSNNASRPPPYVPPPKTIRPPPTKITDPMFDFGHPRVRRVRRLSKTNGWTAALSLGGGNEATLGLDFSGQVRAAAAVAFAASARDWGVEDHPDTQARIHGGGGADESSFDDTHSVPIHAVLSAAESATAPWTGSGAAAAAAGGGGGDGGGPPSLVPPPSSSWSVDTWTMQLIRRQEYLEELGAYHERQREESGDGSHPDEVGSDKPNASKGGVKGKGGKKRRKQSRPRRVVWTTTSTSTATGARRR